MPNWESTSGASGKTNRARWPSSARCCISASPSGTRSSPGAPYPWQRTTVRSGTPSLCWRTRQRSEPTVVVNCTWPPTSMPPKNERRRQEGRTFRVRRRLLYPSFGCCRLPATWLLFDFDDASLGGFRLGQGHREDAVDVPGLWLAAVDARREDERAAEQSMAALG